jgi:hypothetical protein
MVKLCSACRAGKDTTGVLLEDGLVGLDGDGDWAGINGLLQFGGVVARDLSVACNVDVGGRQTS